MKKTDDAENVLDAINQNMPGLLGTSNIRGLGTALIVVDGVPRNASNLNLSEIEQISILKDGNAAMLWGSRAQNGVINITTRRGAAYKRKIEVSLEKGFSTPVAFPSYLNSADYFKLYNEARVNDGLPIAVPDSTIAHYADGMNPYRYPNLQYYTSEYLASTRPFSRVLTEMSGGNENTRYYANIGWNRNGTLYSQGQAAQMHNDRFNMRGNVDFKVNDYVKSSIDAVIIFQYDKQPNGDFWGQASSVHPEYFSPLLPISAVKNTPTLNGQIQTAKKLLNDQYILGGTSTYTNNPYGSMYLAGDNTDNQRTATVNASVEGDLRNITQGLKIKGYMSFDIYNRYSVQTNPTYAIYNPTWQSWGAGVDSISNLAMTGTDFNNGQQTIPTSLYTYDGVATVTPYFERRIGANIAVDYDRTFSDVHHVTGTLLAYWDKFKYNNITIDRKDAHLGLRLTYDYKQKYLVDFTSTYTNGYHLAEGSMGGYAPSVALAWIMSEEGFMKDSKCIDYFKLRASATIQNIDPIQNLGDEWRPWMESFQQDASFSWNDVSTARSTRTVFLNRSANMDLDFEKMKSINVGFEGYFFKQLLYLEANAFTNRWEGIVIRPTGAPTGSSSVYSSWVGRNSSFINNDITGYKGAELGIKLNKSFGKLSIELGGNILYNVSNAIKRSEIWGYDYQNRQGKSADAIFGLVSLGLFKNATEIATSPVQRFSAPKPGDIKYQDINDDGQIDGNDAVEIGNSQARYAYGLNLVLRYGGFSLMAFADGRADYDYFLSGSYFMPVGNNKYSAEALNRWTPATAATATAPRLSYASNSNNSQTSTYWMQSGDYLRLNRVQLTYDIPKKLIQTWPTKEISLYVRGSNVNMWTSKQVQRQLNIGTEPDYRSWALGVNVLF
jgi:TonB-linked SusC/RagA family outer membrane protein